MKNSLFSSNKQKQSNPNSIFLKSHVKFQNNKLEKSKNIKNEENITIPPNIIKHFMSQNDFYYDLKAWKNRLGKGDKSPEYKMRGKVGFIPKPIFTDIISIGKSLDNSDTSIDAINNEILYFNYIKDDIILNNKYKISDFDILLKQYISNKRPQKVSTIVKNENNLSKSVNIPN